MSEPLIYLDHAASTPMRAEAVEAMLPFLTEQFANPSGSHRFANAARRAVDDARDSIAAVLGCLPGDIVFTGSGTESDNAAISGAVWRHGGVAMCPAAEHHAVLHAVERHDGVVVGVDRFGHVDLDALTASIAAAGSVAVVSVMAVNNEVGTITDLAAVARAVRAAAPGAVLHTDAVQAAPWLDLADIWRHVDALSFSAHKFGGPKGVGVLAVRPGTALTALIVGGGQERDRRSGTHNVAGIVATAVALNAAATERPTNAVAVAARRDRLVDGLAAAIDGVTQSVPRDRVAPGSAHVLIDGVENEALLFALDQRGVCASAASACASGAMEPSHVLAAMGVPVAVARTALRMSLGPENTDVEIDRAIELVAETATTLRRRASRRAEVAS